MRRGVEQRAKFDDSERRLQTRPRPVPFEFVDAYPKSIARVIADQARRRDAVVVRAPVQSHAEPHASIIEAVLFGGGAPVFVAPPHWRASAVGQRVLVCWDNSAEAARAAHAALSFIAADAQLVIAHVGSAADTDEASGRALAAHFSRGMMQAEWRSCDKTEPDIGRTLDHIAREISADLIVMGGYRHSPMREAVFGGVTRTLLHSPQLPLFLSH